MKATLHLTRRRLTRGSTLLMAMGGMSLVTMGVLLSLTMVHKESVLQGDERRGRVAFFAAEAGMAEARERLRLLAGAEPTYSTSIVQLGAAVAEAGLPTDFYELMGWTNYTLEAGTNLAVETNELAVGALTYDLPPQTNVFYRVFLQDDDDGDGNVALDSNQLVWLVAVGEVRNNIPGALPVRQVVRAMVRNTAAAPPAPGYTAQKGQSSDKSFSTNDTGSVDFSNSLVN